MCVTARIRAARVGGLPACASALMISRATAIAYTWYTSFTSAPGAYFAITRLYSLMAGSFLKRGSAGSLTKPIESAFDASGGAEDWMIFITLDALDTWLTNICGRHPSLFAWMNAWIANFGVANTMKTLARDDFRRATWELTSDAATS